MTTFGGKLKIIEYQLIEPMKSVIRSFLLVACIAFPVFADCNSDCAREDSFCVGSCDRDGRCILKCADAYGKCVTGCSAFQKKCSSRILPGLNREGMLTFDLLE